jgi:hypothetical protein
VNKMSTPVIFLDIDGVLFIPDLEKNNEGWPFCKFNTIPLMNLFELVKETQSKICISSTWRLHDFGRQRIHVELMEIKDQIIGETPNLERPGIGRNAEIRLFLFDAFGEAWPKIPILILDDDFSAALVECPETFLKINPKIGLTSDDVGKGIQIINNQKHSCF